MSDKKNISIEDRGWEAMHSILDMEMPQKKNRRILPWFFLGAFLIVGLVLFVSRIIDSPNDEAHPAISLNDKTIETDEIKNELELIDELGNKGPTNNVNPVIIKNNDTSTKVSNAEVRNEQEIAKTKVEVSKQLVNKQLPSEENSLIPVISEESIVIENNVFEKETKLKDQKAIDNNLEPKSEIKVFKSDLPDKSVQKLSPLKRKGPHSDIKPLYIEIPFINNYNTEKLDKSVKPIAAVNNSSVLSPYIFGTGNYQSSINGIGYGLGAGLNYQINKLGIYLEAGYHKSNYDIGEISENFSPTGSTSETDGNSIVEDLEGASLDEGANLKFVNFSNLTSGISELKLNLGLRKTLSRRVGIDFGLAYSRLLKVNNKSVSVDLDDTSISNQFGVGVILISSSELFTTGAYGKYDIIPHVGIELNVLPGAYLGLNYNHGLKNLIANTEVERFNSLSQDESIFRRNIEAKLRYQF